MEFSIRFVLPAEARTIKGICAEVERDNSEMIDDNPNLPIVLISACQIFAAHGVHFEITGLLVEPLPVSTEVDLVWFLELLPGLLRFIEPNSGNEFTIGLRDQGIETDFTLTKSADGEMIEVTYSSTISREIKSKSVSLLRHELIQQMLTFVDAYREALTRYYPKGVAHVFNQDIFSFVRRWRQR